MLTSKTWEILIAKFLKKRVIMLPNSVGPFRTSIGRILCKIALNNCDFILVREPISYNVVNSLKIRSPKALTSDTTLLLDFPNDPSPSASNELRVGVSLGIYSHSLNGCKFRDYIAGYAKALDEAIEKHNFSVVFLPHYVRGFSYDDLEVCELIRSKMRKADRTRIANVRTVREFGSIISQMDMIITSKMHPAVLAASALVPSVCIAYDHKQTGFFMSLGLEDCVIPLTAFSHQRLVAKIDYVWNRRIEIRKLLKTRIPELKQLTRQSIEQVLAPIIRVVSNE